MSTRSSANSEELSALGHIRVVELGDITASYATRLLADLGADVIKVEPPGGDPNRLLPPFAGDMRIPNVALLSSMPTPTNAASSSTSRTIPPTARRLVPYWHRRTSSSRPHLWVTRKLWVSPRTGSERSTRAW